MTLNSPNLGDTRSVRSRYAAISTTADCHGKFSVKIIRHQTQQSNVIVAVGPPGGPGEPDVGSTAECKKGVRVT